VTEARLTVGIEDAVTCAEPGRWRSLADVQVGRHVFETLVGDGADGSTTPAVAEDWTVARGGTEWRFKIARDRVFHDGSPLNAEAVGSCLERGLLETAGLGPYAVGLESRGNDTIVLRTAAPVASLLARLAMPSACLAGRGPGRTVGSGPYRHARRDGPRVVLTRARARRRPASYSQLAFVPLRDGRAMWSALSSGAVDVIYECPYDRVPPAPSGVVDGIVVRTCASHSVNMLLFQTAEGAGSSIPLRRAVQAAIDPERMLREVHLGVGAAPRGPISPASPFFDPGRPRAESPGPAPRGARIRVLATRGYYAGALDFIHRELEAASVRCEFELVPYAELVRRLRSNEFEAALTGAAGGADPDALLTELFHSRGRCNFGRLRDSALDGYIDRAREILDTALRRDLYRRAVERISELAPAVFIRHGASIVAHRQSVGGLSPRGDHLLRLDSAFPSPEGGRAPADRGTTTSPDPGGAAHE
jgi:peptide/nickel transport system substrate-binding protein